jgi:hypothetical protein
VRVRDGLEDPHDDRDRDAEDQRSGHEVFFHGFSRSWAIILEDASGGAAARH